MHSTKSLDLSNSSIYHKPAAHLTPVVISTGTDKNANHAPLSNDFTNSNIVFFETSMNDDTEKNDAVITDTSIAKNDIVNYFGDISNKTNVNQNNTVEKNVNVVRLSHENNFVYGANTDRAIQENINVDSHNNSYHNTDANCNKNNNINNNNNDLSNSSTNETNSSKSTTDIENNRDNLCDRTSVEGLAKRKSLREKRHLKKVKTMFSIIYRLNLWSFTIKTFVFISQAFISVDHSWAHKMCIQCFCYQTNFSGHFENIYNW